MDAVTTHHDLTHREGGKVDGGGRKVEGTTDEGTKKGKDGMSYVIGTSMTDGSVLISEVS